MIKLSAHFYSSLAFEVLELAGQVVQFEYFDRCTDLYYEVIYWGGGNLFLIADGRLLNHDFAYETLIKWIQKISSNE